MALTRELLKGMGLTDEQVTAIITEHINVKKDIEKERDGLQKQLDDIAKGTDWKAEYDKLDKSFKDYKTEVAGKEALAAKKTAFRKALTAENIPEKYHDRIIRLENFDEMEMDGDDLKDEKAVRKAIKENWSEYIATTDTKGDDPETPPKNTTTMTRDEIMAIKDTTARQKAIAEHLDLFQR